MNFSASLIYTSNIGCLKIASLRISFVNLNMSITTFEFFIVSSVPLRSRVGSLISSNSTFPLKSLSRALPSIKIDLLKSSRRVLILILSKEVRNDNLPVPYLPVLIRFNLGEIESYFLCGDPKIKNFSIESGFIPASSSIVTILFFKTVTRTFVASSSKAFSTNSFTISLGEIQVLVANSLKKVGCIFNSAVIYQLRDTFLYLLLVVKPILTI